MDYRTDWSSNELRFVGPTLERSIDRCYNRKDWTRLVGVYESVLLVFRDDPEVRPTWEKHLNIAKRYAIMEELFN